MLGVPKTQVEGNTQSVEEILHGMPKTQEEVFGYYRLNKKFGDVRL
jgi:hypothetical protein